MNKMREEWQKIKLKKILGLTNGKTKPEIVKDEPDQEYQYPVYGGNGIIGYSKKCLVEKEKIIIGRVGAYCGTVRYVKEACWVTDNAIFTSEVDSETNIEFLAFLLEQKKLHRLRNRGGQPLVSQKPIKNLKVSIPSQTEQDDITEILTTWDEAISSLKNLIKDKKRYKKGLMQQLLSGGKRFPEFEDEPWIEIKIGDLLKEVEREIDWDDSAKYDLISVKRRSGGIVHRESLYGHEIKTKNLKTVKAGDYIISRMQVLHGASALATKEFEGTKVSGSYHTLVVRDEDKLDIEFFNYLSQTPYLYHLAYVSSHGVHIEKMTFKIDDYLKKKIRIPSSIEEQAKIVSILDNIEKQISLYQKELEAVKKQKKGLMQKLLTGKVRVNQELTKSGSYG